MKRNDVKVKKTLVRNCEQKIEQKKHVAHGVASTSKITGINLHDTELSKPTLCSSELFVNYLTNAKKAVASKVLVSNSNKKDVNATLTKKLNFHFNEKIYRNLIELNSNDIETRKNDKRPPATISTKRDLEPDIEDFYENNKEDDSPPQIQTIRHKFKPVKKVEMGQLHKLVNKYENL